MREIKVSIYSKEYKIKSIQNLEIIRKDLEIKKLHFQEKYNTFDSEYNGNASSISNMFKQEDINDRKIEQLRTKINQSNIELSGSYDYKNELEQAKKISLFNRFLEYGILSLIPFLFEATVYKKGIKNNEHKKKILVSENTKNSNQIHKLEEINREIRRKRDNLKTTNDTKRISKERNYNQEIRPISDLIEIINESIKKCKNEKLSDNDQKTLELQINSYNKSKEIYGLKHTLELRYEEPTAPEASEVVEEQNKKVNQMLCNK